MEHLKVLKFLKALQGKRNLFRAQFRLEVVLEGDLEGDLLFESFQNL